MRFPGGGGEVLQLVGVSHGRVLTKMFFYPVLSRVEKLCAEKGLSWGQAFGDFELA